MNAITILLCALAKHAVSQTKAPIPARIRTHQKTVRENSDLHLTCSTFGIKKQGLGSALLYKNDKQVKDLPLREEQDDVMFALHTVNISQSGNYSCFYAGNPTSQAGEGNSIQIFVIANFLPANLSVTGPLTVTEGDQVEFRCSVSHILQTLHGCQVILSYLRKDEAVLKVQLFNVTQMETSFTIEDAVMRDSGHYSCVVLPSECVQDHENIDGHNEVFLEVREAMVLRVTVTCIVILILASLAMCLWFFGSHNEPPGRLYASFKRRANRQTTNGNVGARREQTRADGGSEEEGYENQAVAEDSTFTDSEDCDGLYSIANNPRLEQSFNMVEFGNAATSLSAAGGRSDNAFYDYAVEPEPVYSVSSKNKTKTSRGH